MIEIKNLTKIFKSKNKDSVKALDNISFNLPDKGFVFIIGKSGSGKTTLLNMISAIDNYNSGEIIFNGISLNNLKTKELDYYRNEKIGFVFQDYQLLENLTVFENVFLALKFQNEINPKKVEEALEKVGLKGFEKRYPKELSGGEKQRVAIARAIVKDPMVILADEPTGNLDSTTSLEILKILNEIAKTKLVLIVTHNILDAHEFASLILELSYGKLVGTYKRNEVENKIIEVKNEVLRLPLHKDISKIDKKEIIEDLNSGIKKIIQDDNDFISCKVDSEKNDLNDSIEHKHISFKNAFILGTSFLKRSIQTIIIYSIIVASLFGIIYSSETILKTDIFSSLNENRLNYDKPLVSLSDRCDYVYERSVGLECDIVSKNDINNLKALGYKGKIYPTYALFSSFMFDDLDEPLQHGLKIIDNDYVKYYFDKLDFHYKNDLYKKEGVYLTDYIIDMHNNRYPNRKLNYTNVDKLNKIFGVPYVNGVINTHYKEKYPQIIECIKKASENKNNYHVLDVIDKKDLDNFIYDFQFYRNFYTFEEDYLDYLFNLDLDYFDFINLIKCKYNNNIYIPTYRNFAFGKYGFNAIGTDLYNKITGKNIEIKNSKILSLDKALEIEMELPKSNIINEETKTIKVTFTHIYNDHYYRANNCIFNKEDKELKENLIYINSLTLENNEDLQAIFKAGKLKNLVINNFQLPLFRIHEKLNTVFSKIFKIFITLLLIASLISLIYYSTYIVKKNIKNIGILKSLGGRNKDILVSLSLNIIITSITTSILSIGLSLLFLKITNQILISSYLSATVLFIGSYNLIYLLNKFKLMIINIVIIFVLLSLSFIFIFIRLKKYKPTELIKGGK